jgi:hypothetical protein
MNSSGFEALDTQLNKMTRHGKILDALEKFYDEHRTLQAGNQTPRKGRAPQHTHLSGFFKTLKSFNVATGAA